MRMATKILSGVCVLASLAASAASEVAVAARQNWPWDAKVIIDVTMPEGTNDLGIAVSFNHGGAYHELELVDGASMTGLSSLEPSPYCLTGGTYRITWDPAACGYDGALENLSVSAKAYTRDDRAWLVIDIPTGEYEYVALGDEPKDSNGKPWQDNTYMTSKMVFRRIPAGTFTRGYTADEKAYLVKLDTDRGISANTMLNAKETTLTSDFYMSIYQTTKAQVSRIADATSTNGELTPDAGSKFGAGYVCFQRGSNSVEGINWPSTKFAVTPTSIVGRFRARCGNRFWIDLPTCAQWQRAARPDTQWLWYDTSSYTGGMEGGTTNDSIYTITNIVKTISDGYRRWVANSGTYSPPDTPGRYLPNSYGLYDLVGSRREILQDWWNSNADALDSAGVDPVGKTSASTRMAVNSYANGGKITCWAIASAGAIRSDGEHNSSQEMCYRYAIHLRPPRSFGDKWLNDPE